MIKKARDAYLNALIQETEALLLSAKKHKDYVGQRQLEQQLAKQKAQREQSMDIRINDDYIIKADKYQWIVQSYRDGLSKNKQPIRTKRETYHGTLLQACQWILNDSAKSCDSVQELVNKIEETHNLLREQIDH